MTNSEKCFQENRFLEHFPCSNHSEKSKNVSRREVSGQLSFFTKNARTTGKTPKIDFDSEVFFSGVTLFSMVIVRHYIHHFTMNSMIFRENNFFQNLILTDYFPKNYYSRQFLFNAVHYYSIVTVSVG